MGNQKKKVLKENFGSPEFYCSNCDYYFEVAWETIWDIQEFTHGYVGLHISETDISCKKCNNSIKDEDFKLKDAEFTLKDEELPF
jgi:hypothetical protein